jgi:hypothetical protein
MAPRGIVAAATASTFASGLVADRVGGASAILPATFVVIVATVTLYGLTAAPVARLLRVVRPSRSRALLVGGDPWVVDLAATLKSTGVEVLMWAGGEQQRERIRRAGIDLAAGGLLTAGGGAEWEGITAVYLLTGEDDFNALALNLLRGGVEGPVHRVRPAAGGHGAAQPYAEGGTLFGTRLTGPALAARHRAGSTVVARPAAGPAPPAGDLLFVVRPGKGLEAVTDTAAPAPRPGDVLVLLTPPGTAG